jgi:HEAT repeat protein
MAAKTGVLPRNLPVAEIQEKLLQSGALGVRQPKQLPAGEKPSIHDPECLPARLPDRTIEECVKALEGTEARTATWQLCLTGKDAVPTLLDLAERGNKDQRFWASVVLAMNRREEAVPALLECVKERRSDLPPNPAKEAPMWMPAMVLLGRVGDPKAVPALSEALLDSRSSLDALIAAVRALGRIGDPAGVPAIEKMLARADLPVTRMLRKGSDVFADVVEDCRWQLELAAAETLAKLGVLRPDLVQRHLLDSRACVRRYAEKVQRFIQEKKRAK